MRKLIVAINVTLDGFADHTAVIADDELHDFYTGLLGTLDALLYGRVTYQLLESYWPHAEENPDSTRSEVEFARKINQLPKIVFSKTLDKVEWNNSSLVKGDIVEEVKRLKSQPGKDLSIAGPSLISYFTKLGLIDEYWLVYQPIVLGNGIRLFEGLLDRVELELIETKTLHSGVVAIHYRVVPREPA